MQKMPVSQTVSRLAGCIRSLLSRRIYYATISFCGLVYTVEIEAPDYLSAQQEAERMLDDCGFLLNLTKA